MMKKKGSLIITKASANNLQAISLAIPHHKFSVITGVSGSGKSSLAFDTIAQEGQRRYFESLPAFSRQFMGKLSPPLVERIEGLSPVITVGQKITNNHGKSTVGTFSDLDGWLRLLFARCSTPSSSKHVNKTRALFSSNTKEGMCEQCMGLGKEEKIDINKLVTQPEKTIKEGALAPTLPSGYIMYSQVTVDVLERVCNAEGFSTTIPWKELTEKQKNVVLNGSQKIKVPFGKHSLESRLKWEGMKAKPREEGFYKGMIPIMSEILKRDRNPSILNYVSAVTCSSCKGKKLNQSALSFTINEKSINDWNNLSIQQLNEQVKSIPKNKIATPIIEKLEVLTTQFIRFGLQHLKLNDPTKNCSLSELQRIRVANQINTDLSGVIYVFDEPSIGLHADENQVMISEFKRLVKKGNTVLVVEHDLATICSADWIIEMGPYAGKKGGEVIFNGLFTDFIANKSLQKTSLTLQAIKGKIKFPQKKSTTKPTQWICLKQGKHSLFKEQSFEFKQGQLNTINGRASREKTALIQEILPHAFTDKTGAYFDHILSEVQIEKVIHIDQSPIGKTPRSNPATYLGISEHIRDLFAKQPKAIEMGLKKSHFSFNTKGGRCESCEGAGKRQIGIHFLGKIDLVCETCNGKRFNAKTLCVTYNNKSIAEIYALSVTDALTFFKAETKITKGLELLVNIGLGYLSLGQTSSTLSGGEAQRIKIANQLQQKPKGHTIYILDEPSIGLHPADLLNLLRLFEQITDRGHTVICMEQDETILAYSDHVIELQKPNTPVLPQPKITTPLKLTTEIKLKGVRTHLLKNSTVRFPKNKLSVVTGISGSGKSSLVFDTLYAESHARFSESFSLFNRSKLKQTNKAILDFAEGLTPSIALKQNKAHSAARSTVGTISEISHHLRLLYSRIAQSEGLNYTAQHFSFNHKLGACIACNGLGTTKCTTAESLIVNIEKPLLQGALTTNKSIRYYLNPTGQFVATLKHIAKVQGWDITIPWNKLSAAQQNIILNGTGEKIWELEWTFSTKTKKGTQNLSTTWKGLITYVNEEYQLKKEGKKAPTLLLDLMQDVMCSNCEGTRLKKEPLTVHFCGLNIHEIGALELNEFHALIRSDAKNEERAIQALRKAVLPSIEQITTPILALGLGYLSINRSSQTLSGGELQRLQLTGQIAAKLYGVTYIFDEPTRGLDQKQVEILLKLLKELVNAGNTVVIVEHERRVIAAADYLVEMGPDAGKNGGEVVFQGTRKQLENYPTTLSYQLLKMPIPKLVKKSEFNGEKFGVKKASKNNLKNIDTLFNRYQINAITGVSGSGKSSLLKGVIYPSFQQKKNSYCSHVIGQNQFDNVYLIDQSPLHLNALATPASYIGILDHLKRIYSQTQQFKASTLKKADLSYLSKNGRCTACLGSGRVKIRFDFMQDDWIICSKCKGLRYSDEVLALQINWGDELLSIGALLEKTVVELYAISSDTILNEYLQIMIDLKIGHLLLGQVGNTLSGGELQRLKLAKQFLNGGNNNLYLLDEPATGLHYFDLVSLIGLFKKIIQKQNTIILVTHNSQLIEAANHVLKLGVGSGKAGGQLIS